jgi:ribosome assembly protein 1
MCAHCCCALLACQVMGAVAAACRRAVLEADPRLVEALYLCQVQASAEALSGVYAVLGRRRARILAVSARRTSALLRL